MRMSCNGCRVLRKGCSDSCSIRPCLQWLKNPESQANATVFLAKFYGRAGLMNLVNAGPENLRPAIFRSLLYEACGRIVNPIYGSVGLLWSGNWQLCQAAVEAVLKGAPIVQISTDAAASAPVPLLNKGAASYDIRHVSKCDAAAAAGHPRGESAGDDLHRVHKATLPRFKRPGNPHRVGAAAAGDSARGAASRPLYYHPETSDDGFDDDDDSSATHPAAPNIDAIEAGPARAADGDNGSSMFSAETTPEGSMVTSPGAEQAKAGERTAGDDGEVELELTLGFEPPHHHSPRASSSSSSSHSPARNPRRQPVGWGGEACSVQLGLELGA